MARSVITIRSLGKFGRFGNQLFQYAFARAMAQRFGAELQTPPWIGQKLFGLSDPPVTRQLPTLQRDQVPDAPNVDLHGYFQQSRHLQYLSHAKIRAMYRFLPRWVERYGKPAHARPYIAAHLRRGDYVKRYSTYFCIVSRESYLRAREHFGLQNHAMVWYSDETAPPDGGEFSFLRDFFGMMHADVLLRANSTFSWWAGTLGTARVYSPFVENKVGPSDVEFVEGNWAPITGHHDKLVLPP
ncbi:MAG TPA: hypothetical protein VHK90_11075 [Thermoanaerobaculia bacterium]|nr:hypothetical protein [Thermoanaerobaculia bacterium]